MSTSKELVTPRVLGTGSVSLNANSTVNADFGTPDDINLAANSNYKPGDRIVAVFRATTAGTTNTVAFSVQDAPDSSGSIGTPATASTTTLPSAATGSQTAVVGVKLQPGRPWLRFRATGNGTTDTFAVSVVVLAIPHNL